MAKWGNCDYKQLQQLRENIAHLQGIDMDKFCKDMSKELARKLLQLVIRRTPWAATMVKHTPVQWARPTKRTRSREKRAELYAGAGQQNLKVRLKVAAAMG